MAGSFACTPCWYSYLSNPLFAIQRTADSVSYTHLDVYKRQALYDTGVTAEYGDRLITLSTCEYSRQNGRMVVVAKKIVSPSLEVGENEA